MNALKNHQFGALNMRSNVHGDDAVSVGEVLLDGIVGGHHSAGPDRPVPDLWTTHIRYAGWRLCRVGRENRSETTTDTFVTTATTTESPATTITTRQQQN